MCRINNYRLSDTAKVKANAYSASAVISKDVNFANGRMVRNLYDDLVKNHARRVVNIDNPGRDLFSAIIDADITDDIF